MSDIPINISTYKGLLSLIQQFEINEEIFRKRSFNMLMFYFVISIAFFIALIVIKAINHMPITVSPELIGTALVPLFSFLYASYEKDYIDQRRSELISVIFENFDANQIQPPQFGDGPIKFEELKNIILKILDDKLKWSK